MKITKEMTKPLLKEIKVAISNGSVNLNKAIPNYVAIMKEDGIHLAFLESGVYPKVTIVLEPNEVKFLIKRVGEAKSKGNLTVYTKLFPDEVIHILSRVTKNYDMVNTLFKKILDNVDQLEIKANAVLKKVPLPMNELSLAEIRRARTIMGKYHCKYDDLTRTFYPRDHLRLVKRKNSGVSIGPVGVLEYLENSILHKGSDIPAVLAYKREGLERLHSYCNQQEVEKGIKPLTTAEDLLKTTEVLSTELDTLIKEMNNAWLAYKEVLREF